MATWLKANGKYIFYDKTTYESIENQHYIIDIAFLNYIKNNIPNTDYNPIKLSEIKTQIANSGTDTFDTDTYDLYVIFIYNAVNIGYDNVTEALKRISNYDADSSMKTTVLRYELSIRELEF